MSDELTPDIWFVVLLNLFKNCIASQIEMTRTEHLDQMAYSSNQEAVGREELNREAGLVAIPCARAFGAPQRSAETADRAA